MSNVTSSVSETPASFTAFSRVLKETNQKLRSKDRENHGHNRDLAKTKTEEFFTKNPEEKVYAYIAKFDNGEGSYYITDTADIIRVRPDKWHLYLYDAQGEELFADYNDEDGITEVRRVNQWKDLAKRKTKGTKERVQNTLEEAQDRAGEKFTDEERDVILARAQKMLEAFTVQK